MALQGMPDEVPPDVARYTVTVSIDSRGKLKVTYHYNSEAKARLAHEWLVGRALGHHVLTYDRVAKVIVKETKL